MKSKSPDKCESRSLCNGHKTEPAIIRMDFGLDHEGMTKGMNRRALETGIFSRVVGAVNTRISRNETIIEKYQGGRPCNKGQRGTATGVSREPSLSAC